VSRTSDDLDVLNMKIIGAGSGAVKETGYRLSAIGYQLLVFERIAHESVRANTYQWTA
jgi:hypothetical protein